MADTAIAITAGTGTNIDTRTEGTNGNHRQVIVLGDPATNAGVAPVDATAGLKVDLGADNDVTVTGTVDLGATDNAVLDTIDAVLDTIKVDTEAIETAVEAIQAGQLADGHNVTIDNPGDIGGGTQYTLGTDTYTEATSVGTLAGAVRNDALATLANTDNEIAPLQVNADGALYTAISNTVTVDLGANNDVTVTGTVDLGATDNAVLDSIDAVLDTIKVDIEAIETAVEAIQSGQLADGHNVTIDNSTGASAVNIQDGGNSITVDGTITAELSAVDNAVLDAIDADLTTVIGHVDGIEGLLTTIDADTGAILADTASMDTNLGTVAGAVSGSEMQADIVASLPAGTNAIGDVGIEPRTSGGLAIFRSIDIDESEEEIKATAGQLFSISAFNTTAAPLFLKFYNLTAANTTVGSDTPVLTFVVPGNADSDGAGFIWNNDIGLEFDTAMTVACTTAVGDGDTGAPGANACIINIGYK